MTGVAASRLGDRIKALQLYDTSIRISQETDKHKHSNAKTYGYKGQLLFEWSQQQPYPDNTIIPESGEIDEERVALVRQRLRDDGK